MDHFHLKTESSVSPAAIRITDNVLNLNSIQPKLLLNSNKPKINSSKPQIKVPIKPHLLFCFTILQLYFFQYINFPDYFVPLFRICELFYKVKSGFSRNILHIQTQVRSICFYSRRHYTNSTSTP